MKRCLALVFLFLANVSYALPNPAAVYCTRHGGKLDVKIKDKWTGICRFRDRSYCEEWNFFRGNCTPGMYFLPDKRVGASYCISESPGKNPIIYLCEDR